VIHGHAYGHSGHGGQSAFFARASAATFTIAAALLLSAQHSGQQPSAADDGPAAAFAAVLAWFSGQQSGQGKSSPVIGQT
jgi:hypothetical protein